MRKSLLSDLLVTAFEGGSNHWIDSVEILTEGLDYADPETYPGNYLISVTPLDYDEPCRDINPATTADAWSRLRRDYPKIAARISDETYDADDADAFLQMICFEDIIFG